MNKRITSLLAVIAMLCTMLVFAMPATVAAAEPTYPCYKDYASAMAAGHDGKNWSISSAEDWKAMRDVADVATEDYFAGVTFHLTNDIDFGGTQMAPMGINPNATAGFAGTIDGHGFGFNNIYVFSMTNYGDAHVVCGLFQRLSNCTFRDFGINSGVVNQASSNNAGSTSSFGAVLSGKTPTFERVWSGATIAPICNAQASGLVGTFSHGDISVNVNGFVFDGTLLKGGADNHNYQYSFGVMGTYNSTLADGDNFYNIITDFDSVNGTGLSVGANSAVTYTRSTNQRVTSALFAFGSETKFNASTIQNVYAVKRENDGIKQGYFIGKHTGSAGAQSKTLLTDMSAVEAAWTINSNPTATNPVYFTLKNGKVRPVATKANAIIKVAVTGDVTANYFLNAGSEVNLAEEIGYKSNLQKVTVTAGEGSRVEGDILYLGENDTTLTLEITCTHDAGFTYTAGENAHTVKCESDCGYEKEELCSADTYTADAITGAELAAGATATHSGTCKFCSEAFVHDCVATYTVPEDGSDNEWDYSDCLCGRENVAHEETGAMVFGDTNKNGEVDLTDVIRLLKRLVDQTIKISDKNADVNGDNQVALDDARQIIRVWLGDGKAKADAEAIQAMVNKGNHFDAANAEDKAMNIEAVESASETNLISEAITVGKGNKVTFGPVRLGQPVLGYAYDADMNPVKLINYENVATQLTFKEGMVMVNYSVPENVKFVKFHIPATEKDAYLIRINSDLTIGEYEARANIESDDLMNPLEGKNVLTTGDSICAAAADTAYAGLKGWAKRIHLNFGANVTNSGVSGAALSTTRVEEKENATLQHQIFNQIMQHVGSLGFDYMLLHGGVNDAWDDVEVGEMSDSFDPATFDMTTYAGGLEMQFYTAVKNYGDTAALGYLINFESPLHDKSKDSGKYFEVGRKICDKWGIPYLDLYNDYKLDTDKYTKIGSSGSSDKIHPTEEGYDLLQPYIDAFMPKMRPVPYEVWSQVYYGADRAVDESGGPLFTASENPYKESLKILAIGNSFSADATQYLWDIANSYGAKNVVIGNMHIGGCSLDTHYNNMVLNSSKKSYSYYKYTSSTRVTTKDFSIEEALKDEEWDIITLQQASDQNATIDTYKYMGPIMSYLNKNKPKEDTKILWHMTWAYQGDSTRAAFAPYDYDQQKMYNVLLDRARYNMSTFDEFVGVIPAGTAIQNLRGTKVGDTVTRDGYHMSYGLGRYTVALTWYCYITGADPREVTFIPNNEYTEQITPYTKEIGESVWEAIQDPYNVR